MKKQWYLALLILMLVTAPASAQSSWCSGANCGNAQGHMTKPIDIIQPGGTAFNLQFVVSPSGTHCVLASISDSHDVSVDWECVEKAAANYDPRKFDAQWNGMAVILKAVRDGKVKR